MSIQNAKVIGGAVNPDDYHAVKHERGALDYPVSPSALKEFARCPRRWVKGYNPPESSAKAFGSLMDCIVLTPEQFSARYAVHPSGYKAVAMECPTCKSQSDSKSCRRCGVPRVPVETVRDWNWNSESCIEWKRNQGCRVIISQDDLTEVEEAAKALRADDVIAAFLDASDRQVLVEGEWHDEPTGLVVPVRCLIDLVPKVDSEFGKCVGDLKTSFTAALQPFSRNVHRFGYHVQAAFDLDLLVSSNGEDRNTWCLIVQESYAPWQPGKRILSQDFIELGRTEYRRALGLYCRCLSSGFWPGYDDTDEAVQGWSICNPEPWMGSEMMFAPRFDEATESKDEPDCDLIP